MNRLILSTLFVGLSVAGFGSLVGCNGSSVSDAIDIADGVDRKPLDKSLLGVNAFASDSRFGTPLQQFQEIRDTLGLRHVRVLFRWSDAVQSGPNATPNFGFYDAVARSIPAGVDALVVLTGVPSWASNPANQVGGNIRTTFAHRWARTVAQRYKDNPRIIGYQIWNEPNGEQFPENTTTGVLTDPAAYVEMLAASHSFIKDISPNKLVINAATTAINQNYPGSIDYNRGMRDAGATSVTDRWAIHYYGKQYENVVRGGGVEDFLDGLNMPVWVTESGAQGVNNQLDYAERTWPFLKEQIGRIERIYQYQFAEVGDQNGSYGLKTGNAQFPVSDLYISLRGSN